MSETNDRQFQYRNEEFNCEVCGKTVLPRKSTCRNHCPFCLTSKHVDINPGDRANPCQGLMQAVRYDLNPKKGLVLIFQCKKCKATTRTIAAVDDPIQADDYDKILKLGTGPLPG